MSPYLTLKIISVAILLVVMVVVLISKKSEKTTEKEVVNDDNEEKQPVISEYELRRISLYRLEYKLIPLYVESAQKNQGGLKNLYDISIWERGIEAWLQASRFIDWEEIACEIYGDLETEGVILYDFPLPFDVPLAKYGAVYINRQKNIYNYYTLERSLNGYMLCSASMERHSNYGGRGNLSKDEFLKEVSGTLGIDDAVLQKKTLIKKKFTVADFKDLVEVSDNDYDAFMADSSFVVVCFYDLFSAHSKIMLPILSEMATEYKGKIKVGIYDVYGIGNETVRVSNNVMAMPTFLFLKNGVEVKRHIGICRKEDLNVWYEELFAN